jgi:hypothetical protein
VAIEPLAPRERQPVHLAALPRTLAPPWPVAQPRACLDWLAEREPLLLLPGRDPAWRTDRASLLALAWIAGDGRRVVWELPAEAPLSAWSAELALIGRLQAALKLLVAPAQLPWEPDAQGLGRWWVAEAGPADHDGVLAWLLAGEEPAIAALASGEAMRGAPWSPGSHRVLVEGGPTTLLCRAADAGLAIDVARRTEAAAWQLTGLVPLPLPALLAARKHGPLIALGEDLARHLGALAALDPELRCTLAPRDLAGAAAVVSDLSRS